MFRAWAATVAETSALFLHAAVRHTTTTTTDRRLPGKARAELVLEKHWVTFCGVRISELWAQLKRSGVKSERQVPELFLESERLTQRMGL